MAINMLNEDSMVKCPKCGSRLLLFNQIFTLEIAPTNEGIKYKKVPYKSTWTCINCNTEIPIKSEDVLNT